MSIGSRTTFRPGRNHHQPHRGSGVARAAENGSEDEKQERERDGEEQHLDVLERLNVDWPLCTDEREELRAERVAERGEENPDDDGEERRLCDHVVRGPVLPRADVL